MLSLESNSTNAKRLNNRGGQLLKEEKERKKIQKVILLNIFQIPNLMMLNIKLCLHFTITERKGTFILFFIKKVN